jgi:hypothetical protein
MALGDASGPEGPILEFAEMPAGPVTLAAIAREGGRKPYRPIQHTIEYGDRISNAPGATSPRTRAVLKEADKARVIDSAQSVTVEQVLSYVIRAGDAALASAGDLRRVVDETILTTLPEDARSRVAHIDVEPALSEGTWFVRVRVALPPIGRTAR